ncbi:MAG: aminoacyl-tRNA hydrolase [Desulfovibrionales bacterium]|nr:aminoacyl-tRNA hydrolase [Desulfovibrionales bacterium]
MAYDGLIVGLGNPGTKYARTRHNFGFMLADRVVAYWANRPGCVCESRNVRLNATVWEAGEDFGKRSWLLVKPLTFMNLSGQVVGELARKHGIPAAKILVMHDELDLPLGTVRFKFSGGLAGHNGLKSVAAHLGTRDFCRLRLGIGRPESSEVMAEYVLRSFLAEEWGAVAQVLDLAVDAVLDYCRDGLDSATAKLHAR